MIMIMMKRGMLKSDRDVEGKTDKWVEVGWEKGKCRPWQIHAELDKTFCN